MGGAPKRPWFVSLVPRRVRDRWRRWMRAKLRVAVQEEISDSPFVSGRFIPVDPLADSFIVPKTSREDGASPDGMPVPPRELWWDYAKSSEQYLEIGRRNIERMRELLRANGGDIGERDRVLDFGCAAGPQTRCLREHTRTGEVWGVDVSGPHVQWCIHNLPTEFRFALTTMAPHLPFEDRYFDLVFCGSVFSHIGELKEAWLLELARVIRPGGRLYLTMVTKQSMYAYLHHWPDLEFSTRVRAELGERWREDFAMAVLGRNLWQHTVHDIVYFRRACEMMFDVLAVARNVYSFQTALVLRRRETARAGEETGAAQQQSSGSEEERRAVVR